MLVTKCLCSGVGAGGSYLQKQEALAHMRGEYRIPEFSMGGFQSTAGTKGSAEKRDEVEPERDVPPPTILRMETRMPGYSKLRGCVCGTGSTQTVRSARSKFEAHSYQ